MLLATRLIHVSHRREKQSLVFPNVVGETFPAFGAVFLIALATGVFPAISLTIAGWGGWAAWLVGAGIVGSTIGRGWTRGMTLNTALLLDRFPTWSGITGAAARQLYRRATSYYIGITWAGLVLGLPLGMLFAWIDRPLVATWSGYWSTRLSQLLTMMLALAVASLVGEALAHVSGWFNVVEGRWQIVRNGFAFIGLPVVAVLMLAGVFRSTLSGYRSVFESLGFLVVDGASWLQLGVGLLALAAGVGACFAAEALAWKVAAHPGRIRRP